MTWVAGADGCKGGWIVALRELATGRMEIRTVEALSNVLDWNEVPAVLCVDVPIGLLDVAMPGGRDCDKSARALLGEPHGRSVFSPPARTALTASSFEEAVRQNRASSVHAIGISRQCFGILPKIRDVDVLISPALQDRVMEVHPEVSFYEMNGRRAVIPSKKSKAGRADRLGLLDRWWSRKHATMVDAHRDKKVARDDITDAMAACWTAERVADGSAIRVPEAPPRDSRGLRMEIVR